MALLLLLSPLLLATTSAHHINPGPPSFSWQNTNHLIAFGDSYTYVQGTHGHQNYSFIGDLQNFAFTPSQLLSNRIVQNQTATAEGGPNWVEHLTGCGLKPGLTDPRKCKTQLWDFAFAGADISEEFTPLHHNFTVSLVNQVKQFEEYGNPVLWEFIDPKRTLAVIWIGINDIGDSSKYDVDFPSFYEELVGTLFGSVEVIYGLGYKKFLFMNLPPLDRTPGNVGRSGGPLPNKTMVDWYDGSLARQASSFGKKHRDAKTMVFDTNTFLNGVMDHHDEYGIRNITGYCPSYDQPFINTDPTGYGCLPLDQYFWFNTGHMTSHVHKILAGAVREYLDNQK